MYVCFVAAVKMGMYTFFLLFMAAFTRGGEDCCIDYCSSSKTVPDYLTFTDAYQERHLKPVGTHFYLDCCSSSSLGLVQTSWFKWNAREDMWTEQQLPDDCSSSDLYRYPCEKNQTLQIIEADMISDVGQYRCEATDGVQNISREFTVDVFVCVKDRPNYLKIIQRPDPVIQVELGKRFQQQCIVEFGCFEAFKPDSHVLWSYHDEDGIVHNITAQRGKHYWAEEGESKDNTTRSVVLIIEEVSEEDLRNVFRCTASKGSKSEPFTFSLQEPASKKELPPWLIPVVVSVLSVIVILIIVVALVFYMCGPTVKYQFLSSLDRLPKRNEDTDYDVMVVGGDEMTEGEGDSTIADTVRERLEQEQYGVYRSHSGRCMISEVDDVLKCVTIIFVIENIQQPLDQFLAVVTETRCNVVFIKPDSFRDSDWAQVSKEYAKTYKNFASCTRVLNWPGSHAADSSLKCKNFWNEVRLSLPKVRQAPAKTDRQAGRVQNQPLLTGDGRRV